MSDPTRCDRCGGPTLPLATSTYCAAECDRPEIKVVMSTRGFDGVGAGAVYVKSVSGEGTWYLYRAMPPRDWPPYARGWWTQPDPNLIPKTPPPGMTWTIAGASSCLNPWEALQWARPNTLWILVPV